MSFSFIKACSLTTDFDIKLTTKKNYHLGHRAATKLLRKRTYVCRMAVCDVWLEGVFQSQSKPSENRWIFNENKTSKRNKIQFGDNL